MSTAPATPRFHILDLARFSAALAVVLFHYFFRGWISGGQSPLRFPEIGPWFRYGYLGVQFFFMISGFVIFMSAQGRSAGEFARARFLRLYPAYWLAVLLTSGVIALWGAPHFHVTPLQVLINLTMLQQFLQVPHVDGVYWTLTFELVFYGWIFVLLKFQRLDMFWAWSAGVLALSSVARVATMPGWLRLLLLADYGPYFIAGALFFLSTRGPLARRNLILLGWAFLLTMAQATGEAAEQSNRYANVEMNRTTIAAIVALFFLFFLSVRTGALEKLKAKWVNILGAATYPLYLLHQYIGYIVFWKFQNSEPRTLTTLATLVAITVTSMAIARYWEPAITSLLLTRFRIKAHQIFSRTGH